MEQGGGETIRRNGWDATLGRKYELQGRVKLTIIHGRVSTRGLIF
jgi:hypothetical protein